MIPVCVGPGGVEKVDVPKSTDEVVVAEVMVDTTVEVGTLLVVAVDPGAAVVVSAAVVVNSVALFSELPVTYSHPGPATQYWRSASC